MLAVMAFGSLMTIVTVSLDEIATDLGSDRTTLTWMITGLMVAMAVCTPLAGKLGDLRGHRLIFLIGLGGGAVTTLGAALAWDATSIIVLRVLFGVTGALLMPSGMALMMHAYGPQRRAAAMGWFQFANTGAPTLGLVAGGPLIEVIGWRGMFVVFAGVTAAALVLGIRLIRPIPRQADTELDYLGAATLAAVVLTGLLALTRATTLLRDEGPLAALADAATLALVTASVVSLVGFVLVEQRATQPMLALRYFRRRNFTLPIVSSAAGQFAYMGGFVVTPALLASEFGYGVGAIALLMTPRPGAVSLASPLGGNLAAAIGERRPMVGGAAVMVGAMAAFAGGAATGGGTGIALIVVGLVLTGVSAGIAQPAVTSMVVDAVDHRDMGIATGMAQQIMFIGVVSGIQTMNVLVGDDATAGRFVLTYALGAVVAAVGLAAALGTSDADRRALTVAAT